MSILETFGLIFESDAKEMAKDVNEANQSLGELESTLEDVGSEADKTGRTFDDFLESVAGFAAGLVSIGAVAGSVISAAARTDEIGKFTQTLGLSIEEVSAWGEAVVRSGGDANAFMGSVRSLTEQLTEFQLTGSGPAAETLARLGISAVDATGKVKGAFDILPELADKFQELSAAESFGLGQRLGLDQGTILLLQQGRRAVEDLVRRQKELGVATEEDYQIAAKFNDQWADTVQVFRAVAVSTGSTLLPVFTTLLQGVEKFLMFLADNEDLVVGFFVGAAVAITKLYLPAIISAAAATLTAIAPFLAVGVAIGAIGTAVAIVYEDVKAFLSGQSSLIGDLSKDYPLLGEVIKAVASHISALVDGLVAMGEFLFEVFTQPEKALMRLQALMNDVLGSIPDFGQAVSDASGAVADFFGFGDEDEAAPGQAAAVANQAAASAYLQTIDTNPLNSMTSNSIVNNDRSVSRSTAVSIAKVDVNTQATDSETIYKETSSQLATQMRAAVNDFDDGVKA